MQFNNKETRGTFLVENEHVELIRTKESNENGNMNNNTLKLFKWRWVILLCYCLLSFSCNSGYFVFTTVSKITQRYYNINLTLVNLLTIVYESLSIILSAPFSYLIDKKGISLVLVLISSFNALGAGVRYMGANSDGYWLLLLGTCIRSIAMAGFMFLPPRIAAIWFGPRERGTATAIGVATDAFGIAFGLVQASGMIHNHSDQELLADDFGRLLLSQAILAVFVFFFIINTVRDRPPSPPSRSQALSSDLRQGTSVIYGSNKTNQSPNDTFVAFNTESATNVSFFREMTILLRNRQFMLILHLHALVFILETLISTFLNELLISKYPGEDFLIGIIAAVAVLGSVISNILIGFALDRTKRFLPWSWGIFVISILAYLAVVFLYFYSDNLAAFSVAVFIAEGVSTSYYTVAFDHGAESTYPVPESTSGMILIVSGQAYAVILCLISTELLNFYGPVAVFCIMGILSCSSILFLIPLREASLRTDIDKGKA